MKRIFFCIAVILNLSLLSYGQVTAPKPCYSLRETDQTLPAGAWRTCLDGDKFRIEKNSAAGGNYSTLDTNLDITSTGVVDVPSFNPGLMVPGAASSVFYNFVAQVPGGSLTAATPATITLTPVPYGVNGTDTAHYLYVSGGTGTAEAVLISGGTAVSNAASGTITFTPANNHTGAWNIASATAGIQEAINIVAALASATGSVYVPPGAHVIYATITVPAANNIELFCAGPSASKLMNFTTDKVTISIGNTFGIARFHDCLFWPQATRNAYELEIHNTGFAYIDNVHVLGGSHGFHFLDVNTVNVSNVNMNSLSNTGMYLQSSTALVGGVLNNITINAGGTTGYPMIIQADGTGIVSSIQASNLILQGGTNNLLINQSGMGSVCCESLFSNIIIDTANTASVKIISDRLGYGFGLTFNGLYGGPSGSGASVLDAEGIYGLEINNSQLAAQNGSNLFGLVLRGVHKFRFTDSTLTSTGTAIDIVADHLGNPSTEVSIVGNDIGKTLGGSIQNTGGILVSNAAHSSITIRNNIIDTTTTDISWAGTGTGNVIQNNILLNSNTKPSAATYGSQLQGSTWFTKGGGGVADTYEVLRKDAAGTYAWTNTLLGVSGLTNTRVPFANSGGALVDDSDLTFATDTLTATKLAVPTSAAIGTSTMAGILNVVTTADSIGTIRSQATTDLTNDYAQLVLIDDATVAANIGGIINFAGNYTGTTVREWAAIQGAKENATDANYAGMLRFFTRADGSGGFGSQERLRIGSTGKIFMYALSTSAANQTDSLCLSSGNEVIADTQIGGCIVSSLRYKDWLGPINRDPTNLLLALKPGRYIRKNSKDTTEHFGFLAEDVAKIEPRLATFDPDGKPEGVQYQLLTAPIIAAFQQLEERIKILEARIKVLEAK